MPSPIENCLGDAFIDPADPVVAGSLGSWCLGYRVGSAGIAVGGGIAVDTDSDSDWGELQFDRPDEVDYTTVECSGEGQLSWVLRGGFLKQKLVVAVHGEPLRVGDEIRITIGDRRQGGPGSRAQTFAEARRYFQVAVDASGDGGFVELGVQPFVPVVGGEAASLSALTPSQVSIGEPFALCIRALDRFGNPSHAFADELRLGAEGVACLLPERCRLSSEDHGVLRLEGLSAAAAGMLRVTVEDSGGQRALSNPIEVAEAPLERRLYWGDLHGQVRLDEKIEPCFAFARDVSALDFTSHQRNDHEIDTEHWRVTQRVAKRFNQPGRFAAFLGYEWSGPHAAGGDHNLLFLDDDQPIRRSGHDRVDEKSDIASDLPHIEDVYRNLNDGRSLLIPHVGGRPANLDFHDPALEPVLEIHSTHGTFEWFLCDALERGLEVGVIAGSDDYKLRQGGAYPGVGDRRFARGGLTAVCADELSREEIFEALRARRCYGTSGERILLELEADGHPMGAAYETSAPPTFDIKVAGTASIETIELFRGAERIFAYPQLEGVTPSRRIKLSWEGSSRRWPYSGVLWQGALRIEGGAMSGFEPTRLARPDAAFVDVDARGFRWRSWTAGAPAGASFEVDDSAQIALDVSSTPTECVLGRVSGPLHQVDRASLRLRAVDIGLAPTHLELGDFERRLTIRRLPDLPAATEISLRHVDSDFTQGRGAYWLRVVQSDGEMAWSSPIFVTLR